MALQSTNNLLDGDAFGLIRGNAAGWKAQGQNALATMQSGSINSDFVFRLLDQLGTVVSALTAWKATSGLDTYAIGQGYSGTLSSDCASTITAAQAVISWVTTNFPADTGGFLQAYTLNADGTRTPRAFTTAQTAGLQTALSNFVATIA